MRQAVKWGSVGLLVLALAWFAFSARIVNTLSPYLVDYVSHATGLRIEVDSLDIGVLPPRFAIEELRVGLHRDRKGKNVLTISDLALRLSSRRSWRDGVASVDLSLRDAVVDLRELPRRMDDAASSSSAWPVPAFVGSVRFERLHVAIDENLSTNLALGVVELAGEAEAGVRFDFQTSDATVHLAPRRVDLSLVRAAGGWRNGLLSLDKIDAMGAGLVARGRPDGTEMEGSSGLAPLDLDLGLDLAIWSTWLSAGADISGHARVRAVIGGVLDDLVAEGSLRIDEAQWQGRNVGVVFGKLERMSSEWRFSDLRIDGPFAKVEADLRLVERDRRLDGNLAWRDANIAALIPGDEVADALLSGRGALDVDLRAGRIAVAGDGVMDTLVASYPYEFDLKRQGEESSARVRATIGAGNVIRGDVSILAGGDLRGEIDASFGSIGSASRTIGWSLPVVVDGPLISRARLRGSIGEPELDIHASSRRLVLSERGSSATVIAAIDLAARVGRESAWIERLRVEGGGGVIEGGGVVRFDALAKNEWWLRADDLQVAPWLRVASALRFFPAEKVSAVVDGRIDVSGAWQEPRVSASLVSADTTLFGVSLGSVDVALESANGEWRVTSDAKSAEGSAVIVVSGAHAAVGNLDIEVRKWPVADSLPLPNVQGGTLSLDGSVRGVERQPVGSIDAKVDDLRLAGIDLGDSQLRAQSQAGVWSLAGQLFDRAADVRGSISVDGTFSTTATWSHLEFPLIASSKDGLTLHSSGTVEALGNLAHLGRTSAVVAVRDAEIRGGVEKVFVTGVEGRIDDGIVSIAPFVIKGEESDLNGACTPDDDGSFSLVLEGDVSLAWLEALVPAVSGADGEAAIEVSADWGDGVIDGIKGTITVQEAGLEIEGAPPVEKLGGAISFTGRGAKITDLRAEMGGGRVRLSGEIDGDEGPDLKWRLLRVALEPVEAMELVLSGDGSLHGKWDDALLAGEIGIEELYYNRDISFQDLIPSFARTFDPPQAQADRRPPLRCDLRIRARDGLHVENNIAELEASADLAIAGTLRAPEVQGDVSVLDGGVVLRGRRFEIVNGVLSFQPELRGTAVIDFLAESVIETQEQDYGVEVRVSGTTDRYRVSLSSDDGGLSQTDIASLITFGKTVSQLRDGGGSGGGISVDKIAGLAGGQFGKMLSGEVLPILPFDEVQLRPGFSPSSGAFEPQIRVGKRISQDLYAWVAQTFGVQSRTSVEATYDLGLSIATVLRWESRTASQEGAVGGELTQRFEFWQWPSWLRWGR